MFKVLKKKINGKKKSFLYLTLSPSRKLGGNWIEIRERKSTEPINLKIHHEGGHFVFCYWNVPRSQRPAELQNIHKSIEFYSMPHYGW